MSNNVQQVATRCRNPINQIYVYVHSKCVHKNKCVVQRVLTTSCSRPLQQESFSRCSVKVTQCSRRSKTSQHWIVKICFYHRCGVIHEPTKSGIFDGTSSLPLCKGLRSLLSWQVTSCCGDTKVKGESWTSVRFTFCKSVYVWRKRGLVGVLVRPWGRLCVCVKGSVPSLAAPWETRLKENLLADCDICSLSL